MTLHLLLFLCGLGCINWNLFLRYKDLIAKRRYAVVVKPWLERWGGAFAGVGFILASIL
jgi:hypothetical protein